MPTLSPSPAVAPLIDAGLTAAALASLTGRSLRTAERWISGANAPRGEARERLVELATIIETLADSLPGADPAEWLARRDPDLDFATPAELIARGDAPAVLALLTALGEGAYL